MTKKYLRLLAVPTLAITALTGILPAQAVPAPLLGPTGGPGSYTEQNIASELFGDSSNYRIPALADLGDGVLLASWDGRPYNAADSPNPNSILMRRSTDGGKTWSPISYIAKGNLGTDGSQKYGYSDPSFVVDHEAGKVFAFFVYSKNQGFWGGHYGNDIQDPNVMGAVVVESSDQGLTWSEPRDITAQVKPGNDKNQVQVGDVRATFATSGEGIQLRYGQYKGRLIQQFAGMVKQADGQEKVQAYSVYSDDHGATWQRGEFAGIEMDENKVVELSDGRVMLNSRDFVFSGYRKVAISEDGGHSYSPVTLDTELPDPRNNASIFRMHPDAEQGSADAKKLIFTHSNNGTNGDRINLAARVSCDDGQTWPGVRTFKQGFGAYSTGTALSTGGFGVFYEANYTNDMRFASFDEDWLNYVCAPLSADPITVTAGQSVEVPVTITNQEASPISGRLALADTAHFTAPQTEEMNLAPGESRTVTLRLNTTASARSGKIDAVFTADSGKQSRYTTSITVEGSAAVFGATIHNASANTRNVVEQPYRVGEKITYTFSVTNTSDEAVAVVPTAGNFDAGFLPPSAPNCRYSNLAAGTSYTCTTATHTVTQEDLDRGYFMPTMTFRVSSRADSTRAVTINHTGSPVALRQIDLTPSLTITGEAASPQAENYQVGDQISYRLTVQNTSTFTVTSTPTAGNFDTGFFTTGIPNCRWRNLAAGSSYTCTTAVHTVTAEDLERGYFTPSATFTATSSIDASEKAYSFTGQPIPLPQVQVPSPEPTQPQEPLFADVPTSHPLYQAIQWAGQQNIIEADRQGNFNPRGNIRRGELAVYLFRLHAPADYQAPQVSPFRDVATSHPYYREITWAYQAGLMQERSQSFFRPISAVQRQELAFYAFNQAKPANYQAPQASPYRDVVGSHSLYREISWFGQQQQSQGIAFGPIAPLKREDLAAYLYENFGS